jgi:hypothetical protein
MADEISYLRGAFIAYDPGGYPARKRVIPFRFNPEPLSRQISVEQSATGGGTEGAAPAGQGNTANEQSADSSLGTLKETFSVLVRLDFADRVEAARNLPPELGVAPEISAMEDLMYPAEPEDPAPPAGDEPVRQRLPRPTVLFVWGRKRVVPVRITQITVNEAVDNNQLLPVRAELDVACEVLGRRTRATTTPCEPRSSSLAATAGRWRSSSMRAPPTRAGTSCRFEGRHQ